MSIINDALKKAEQFKKWSYHQVPAVSLLSTPDSASATAVEEPMAAPPPEKEPEAPLELELPKMSEPMSAAPILELTPATERLRLDLAFSFSRPVMYWIGGIVLTAVLVSAWIWWLNHDDVTSGRNFAKVVTGISAGLTPESAGVLVKRPEPSAPPVPARPDLEMKENLAVGQLEPSGPSLAAGPVMAIAQSVTAESGLTSSKEPSLAGSALTRFRLTGVYELNEHERYAFINDKVVQLGDKIGGATVSVIDKKSVTLKRGDKVVKLSLE